MELKLLLEHNGTIYDASPIVLEGVRLEQSVLMEAGKLIFAVKRDGIINFVEGDKVQFAVNGIVRFCGFVMKKERTDAQMITVTAYDMLFYLAKNKGTYVYWDKTAKDVVAMIAGEYGLPTGTLQDTVWKIPQRIEQGQTLLDMIQAALTLTQYATGKEYFLYDSGGLLVLKERQTLVTQYMLRCDGSIQGYHYVTDLTNGTYNEVRLYQAGRKEVEHLAWETKRPDKIKEWGKLGYYAHVSVALNEAQLKEMAESILKQNGHIQKTLVVDNCNGDVYISAGQSVYLEIPDLAEIGITKTVLVEKSVHIFREGMHQTKLYIRVEE